MYFASKKELITRNLFEEQGTSECTEWFKIDCKLVLVTPLVITGQFGIIQNLQRFPVPQKVSGRELF